MIDDALLSRLKGIGMSEYEAKVYAILSALRVASGREIHEQTRIPRGRVYETLATLAEKGYIVSSGTSPARYSPVDVHQVFERLKRESVRSLDTLYEHLRALETEAPEPLDPGYVLRTEWTRDNQIRMMLRRAKAEIIILCNDEAILNRYSSDIARAAKRVFVYLVIGNEELADLVPVRCYTGGNDMRASLFSHDETENISLAMKLSVIADRRELLFVAEEDQKPSGIFICPDIYASYLARKIIQEIRPVDRAL
jgi:sugar-specific transcriptional regulator TrmB